MRGIGLTLSLLLLALLYSQPRACAQNSAEDIFRKIKTYDLENLTEEQTNYVDSCVRAFDPKLVDADKVTYYVALVDAFMAHDNYIMALASAEAAAPLLEKSKRPVELADLYSTKSLIHDNLGQYPEALVASQNSLELYMRANDSAGIAHSYNDIGVLHYYRGDDSLAQDYHNKSLAIFQQLKDTSGIALYYNNMANTLFEVEEYQTALEMYQKGYEFDLLLNDLEGQSITLSNIGETYIYMKDYAKAEETLLASLKAGKESGDSWTISNPLRGLGQLYIEQGRVHEAINVLHESVALSHKTNALAELSEAYQLLYQLHKQNGNLDSSITYLELHKATDDEIFSEGKERLIGEMEIKYQLKDKAREVELVNKARQIDELEHQQEIDEKQSTLTTLWISLAGFILVLVFVIRGFVLKRRANLQLTTQNKIIQDKNSQLNSAYQEIEAKSTEILDSIRYAKRIQSAILPPASLVKSHLSDSFILYKPKDVVAGDFYWLEPHDGRIFFAAADCTGHGVPGAMVSVICHGGLNRSVREYDLTNPGQILDKTREIVIEAFERSEDELRDGMDIALCSLEGNMLTYAGANNPLWVIRKDEEGKLVDSSNLTEAARIYNNKGYSLLEIKGDKQPIGRFVNPTPYKTHTIELQKNDSIYIFSDGFVDQFGGKNGKKLKAKMFKELLISLQNNSMEAQKMLLEKAFETWRGELEQIDDVCVIGVRV